MYRAGILCEQLPLGSRVKRELNKEAAWNYETRLCSLIEYNTRCILHAFLSTFSKGYKSDKEIKPIEPINKKTIEEDHAKHTRSLILDDGNEILPVTREELAKMFHHDERK